MNHSIQLTRIYLYKGTSIVKIQRRSLTSCPDIRRYRLRIQFRKFQNQKMYLELSSLQKVRWEEVEIADNQ